MKRLTFLACFLAVSLFAHQTIYADEGLRYTKPDSIACYTEEWFDKFASFMARNDREAAAKLITEGQCLIMPSDLPVYVEEIRAGLRKIKIRRKGYTEGVWTYKEAIR